jgi:hypothetical protein
MEQAHLSGACGGFMAIETLDSVSLGADLTRANEDASGRAGARAWVIDGATDLGPPDLFNGLTGAAWIAHLANARFAAHAGATVEDQIAAVFSDIASAFAREASRAPCDRWEEPVASFLACDIRSDRVSAYWLGDCVGMVLTASGTFARFGGSLQAARQEGARAQQLMRARAPEVSLLSSALPDLRAARNSVNGAGGGWLLGLHAAACAHLSASAVPLDGPALVLLMTDGFAALCDRYTQVDDRGQIESAGALGLAPLAAHLRRVETVEDPDCARWPRFKPRDDATALLLRVS